MRISTIILLAILISSVFIVSFYLDKADNNSVDFGGIKIDSYDLKELTEPLGEGQFMLCSIPEDKCVISSKAKL